MDKCFHLTEAIKDPGCKVSIRGLLYPAISMINSEITSVKSQISILF